MVSPKMSDVTDQHRGAVVHLLRRGFTQKDVGIKIGASPSFVSRMIENYEPYRKWVEESLEGRPRGRKGARSARVHHMAWLVQSLRKGGLTRSELAGWFDLTVPRILQLERMTGITL